MTNARPQREQYLQGLALAWESRTRSQRRQVAVVEYYCRQRHCLLLTVFQSPDGLFVTLPRYRKSPERNAAGSVPSARAKRTVDGDRRWKPRVAPLDQFADPLLPQLSVELNCNHYSQALSGVALLADVNSGRPGAPSVRHF